MKHIFLNLKRFDISPEKGGVNRLAPMKDWGRTIVSGTQDALTAYDPAEVEFVMYMPEAHLLGAAAAKTENSANKGKDTKIRREIAIATKECMLHEGIEGYLVSHGSSTVPQEYVQGINALGGQLENAFGIDVAQLVDVAHCGINKINVDTDIRLACTRNLLELFENEPELRESASIGQLYKDLKKNPKNFDPRNYVASIMDTITLGTVPDAHVQKVVDCMKDGVTESIAPLLVQFGSYRKSHLIEVVTCEQMAERYKKAGI